MPTDDQTFEAIYKVQDEPTRAALRALFALHREEHGTLAAEVRSLRGEHSDRLDEVEADARTRNVAISFGRWLGPIVVAIAIYIAGGR